jgi:1-acyl-sn-glycerol-3-phosphate acyltransferase
MPKLSVILHTLISRFLLLLILLLGTPIIFLMILLPEKYRYQSKILFGSMRFFYWAVVKATLVPISYEGGDNVPDEPVVFVANHQSALDIPLLGVFTKGRPHVWLARYELMKWKFLRWVLPRMAVVINPLSREKAMGSLRRLLRLAKAQPLDVMIFPEGARYSDDKVHKFYGGFVMVAKLLNYKVVPVYISGANKVYPPDTFWVKRHPITVIAGKPFELEKDESDDAFKDRVYQWFVAQSER